MVSTVPQQTEGDTTRRCTHINKLSLVLFIINFDNSQNAISSCQPQDSVSEESYLVVPYPRKLDVVALESQNAVSIHNTVELTSEVVMANHVQAGGNKASSY